jgi:hypothetical protein
VTRRKPGLLVCLSALCLVACEPPTRIKRVKEINVPSPWGFYVTNEEDGMCFSRTEIKGLKQGDLYACGWYKP